MSRSIPRGGAQDLFELLSAPPVTAAPAAAAGADGAAAAAVAGAEGADGGELKADGVVEAGGGGNKARALESFLLFVGEKQSGKSTLVNHFLNPNKDDRPKATVALEYTYGRRSGAGSAKDIAHIWELGGGKRLQQLIEVPITVERLAALSVAITVDLSKPGQALQTLVSWMALVRTRVAACLQDLQRADPAAAQALLDRARKRVGGKHPDVIARLVDPCPCPIMVVATKYDLLANEDSAKRKVLLGALRYVAHSNGASLHCFSRRDKVLQSHFRALMNHHAFRTAPKKSAQLDAAKPVVIPAGADAIKKIGAPMGSDLKDFLEGGFEKFGRLRLARWKEAVEAPDIFMPLGDEDEMDLLEEEFDQDKFAEATVDQARAAKDEALERYRREAERRLRMASDMPGQGGGGGGGVRSVPASGGGSSKERRSKDRSSGRSSRSRAAASGTETKDPAAGAGSAGAGYGGPPTGK